MSRLHLAVILLAGILLRLDYLVLEVVFFIMVFTWEPKRR